MTTHRFIPTTYHNVIGSLSPALHIADGDTVVTQTLDASGHDREGARQASGPNPMNGPIFVEGAEPGDALRVEIETMVPTRSTGWTRSVLAANVVDRTPLPVQADAPNPGAVEKVDSPFRFKDVTLGLVRERRKTAMGGLNNLRAQLVIHRNLEDLRALRPFALQKPPTL